MSPNAHTLKAWPPGPLLGGGGVFKKWGHGEDIRSLGCALGGIGTPAPPLPPSLLSGGSSATYLLLNPSCF
jgi:hypothetical protein